MYRWGQIFLNENKRFQVDDVELTSGFPLQVLVYDGSTDFSRWVDTRVEFCDDPDPAIRGYFLVGLWGYFAEGLFARIKV